MQIPYGLVAAVDIYKREAQMALALQYGYPRLQRQPIDDQKTLTLACYGPSLADTYQTMTRPILSMSGATRWLADRGIVPDYHIDMDPRPHKVHFLDPPIDGVHYLMATVCHPKTWELLKGQQVTLWHTYSAPRTYDWVASVDQDQLVIHGGSTIGLTALHLGGVLGYRHFEIHGMDGSFRDASRSARHAGPHPGTKQQDGITWQAGGVIYQTSKVMSNAVAETLNALANFPIFCVFHGQGLTQALVKEQNLPNACCADELEKADRVRKSYAHILDVLLPKAGDPAVTAQMWEQLCTPIDPSLLTALQILRADNEKRRAKAKYNTGSITLAQMAQLRALCLKQQPKVIVEIGTFIGNSTLAMQAKQIYTCDGRNDCFPKTSGIQTFPFTKSTAMFQTLVNQGVKADLFFFDGRIKPDADLPLIQALSHPGTIYVMDDYKDMEKGVINAKLLATMLPQGWVLVEPDHRLAGESTLAAFAPKRLFG